MKSKKWSYAALSFLLVTVSLLAGCGNDGNETPAGDDLPNESAKSLTIKIDHNWGQDHPNHIALMEKFKPIVEEKSNGSLKVEIYGNNQLGGEREIFNGVNNGTIEMIIAGTVMSSDIEKWAVAGDWPFLINNFEHAKKVFTGEIGQEIAEDIEAKSNTHVLGWGASGFRMFSSTDPIESVEDFKGKRIRMPNIDTFVRMGELLGINVIPLDFTEVFTALEQGVADGQENPISIVKSNGWYEVQNYILESKHIFFANAVLISDQFWNELSKEQQTIIQEAVDETVEHEWGLIEQSYEDDKKFLEENGITFITPDEEFEQNLQEKIQPLYDELYEKYPWAEDMVNRIKAEAQ